MAHERRSEAGRHKADAHAAVVLNLKLAREAMELVQDWEHSWPNSITNFEPDIESVINRIRAFQRQVQPPTVESNPHARGYEDGERFDYADGPIIKIQDVD